MRARKLSTEDRKRQIAEATLQIIADRGLEGLSIGRIARQVGVVPSAIYRHFDGKKDVVDATLDLIRNRLKENVHSVCEEATQPMEQLRILLMRHIRMIRQNKGIPRLIFSGIGLGGEPERRRKLYGIIQNYLDQIGDIVKEGQRSGEIRSDVDSHRIAVMFLGMIQPGAILWHLSDGHFDVTKQARKAWELFSQSLQPASDTNANGED